MPLYNIAYKSLKLKQIITLKNVFKFITSEIDILISCL